MPLRTRMDTKKAEAERLQAIVIDLLREEENKYCADCEAKQPRWASWNLGVFLCIRCAGIHRNLGVHLTKVKSVNLDSWTPEQVQSMRIMGNKMARRVYEAELPEHFRRPQTDSALESFIRAKYEHKRYILKDWSPPPVDVSQLPPLLDKRHHPDRGVRLNSKKDDVNSNSMQKTQITGGNVNEPKVVVDMESRAVADIPLLDLSTPATNLEGTFSESFAGINMSKMPLNSTLMGVCEGDGLEDFGPIVSAPPVNSHTAVTSAASAVASSSDIKNGITNSGSDNNLKDLVSVLGVNSTVNEKKSTSDILALYGAVPKSHPMAAKQQIRSQNFSEVLSVEGSAFDKSENMSQISGASNMGAFLGSPTAPYVQSSFGTNISSSDSVQLDKYGSRTNTISVGNLFLNHEAAAIFAAASPFANNPSTTGNADFLNSKPITTDIPYKMTTDTKHSSLNHFVADFRQLNMGSESRGQNSFQTNIPWN